MNRATINDVSKRFVTLLAAYVGKEKMREIADRNAVETDPNVCHSHDFCDANEFMAEAFAKTITGWTHDPTSEAQAGWWNDAWTLGKFRMTRLGLALADCGFELEHQGGGLFNWRKLLDEGTELFCCAEDGTEPDDVSLCHFGACRPGGDTISVKTYARGAQLAELLVGAGIDTRELAALAR